MNAEKVVAQMIERANAAFEPYLRQTHENFHRIGRLISASEAHNNEDILRSAVVFMHATLEDSLRSIASAFLPNANEAALNRIPLAGSSNSRPDKFLLGRLSAHRKRTVEELIKKSVDEYLQHETFNSVSDIVELLHSLDFEIKPLESHFGSLDAMMKRRHQIVHCADREMDGKLVSINGDLVGSWVQTLIGFMGAVSAQVSNKNLILSAQEVLRDVAKERGFDL